MKLSQSNSSRPLWYDRNATMRNSAYSGSAVAPHGATTRFTYTCPVGKKAMIEIMQAIVVRDGATGTPALTEVYHGYTPNGGSLSFPVMGVFIGGAVGNSGISGVGTSFTMLGGDALAGGTLDTSTGGTNTFVVGFKGSEFDA